MMSDLPQDQDGCHTNIKTLVIGEYEYSIFIVRAWFTFGIHAGTTKYLKLSFTIHFADTRGSASVLRITFLIDPEAVALMERESRLCHGSVSCLSRVHTATTSDSVQIPDSRFQILHTRIVSSIEFEPLTLATVNYVARCVCPGLGLLGPGSQRFDMSSRAEPSVRTCPTTRTRSPLFPGTALEPRPRSRLCAPICKQPS